MSIVHEMELQVTVRIADLTITEANAVMHTFPHAECPAIVSAFAGLAGLSITRGYTRQVQERFGGPRGCTHLEQLARSLGPLVVQAVTSRRARAVSRGEVDGPSLGARQPVGPELVPHLGRGRDRRPEVGRRLASGHRPLSRSPARGLQTAEADPVTPGSPGRARRAVARRLAMVTVVVAAAASAGCTGSGVAVTSPFSTAPPVLQHGAVYEVKVRDVAGLGPVLVDGQGITLYLFTTDQQGQPSRCYDICAVQWPPLTLPHGVMAPMVGAGIQPRLLGTAPADRRDHPGHLQRVAVVPVATGPRAGPGQRPGAHQCRRAVVRGRPVGQCRQDLRQRMSHPGPGRLGGIERADSASKWSINSTNSILSINSKGSILSIGSTGSVLSIGSIGSAASLASIGSCLSVASLLSFCSFASVMSFRSRRGILSGPRRAQLVGPPSQPRLRNR